VLKKHAKSSEAQLFNEYCGLTCLGGSEKKQCKCAGPQTCELRNDPRFKRWRHKAKKTAFNYILEEALKVKEQP